MNTKQTHTAQQNFLFMALLQAEYAKQKNVTEELLNILLLVVHATRLCKNENCFSGMDASDENCCEFANANSIAQTAGTPFERYELNYNLDYEYDSKFVHRAKRIGKQHYLYDLNGNLISEQEGAYNEAEASSQHEVIQTGNLYSVDYGWGMVNPDAAPTSTPNITRRNYTWNERNLLKTSTDRSYSVQYKYGADGQRSAKYSVGSNGVSETLYFNKMWNWRYDSRIMQREGRVSKHIYLGETRILTKLASADTDLNAIVSEELTKQYYYHTDHLGSAQLISDHDGKEYERIEYTPYGELWIEKKTDISQIDIPFRFTGKERDEETGLYYYGARYLDAKTSRWLSTDPALGDYIPQAPINDEAKKANGNLPGMGGVFNTVNSHLYHYAGNNPVKFIDPTGKDILPIQSSRLGSRIETLYNKSQTFRQYFNKLLAAKNGLGERLVVQINDAAGKYAANTETNPSSVMLSTDTLSIDADGKIVGSSVKKDENVQAIFIDIDVDRIINGGNDIMAVIAEEIVHAADASDVGADAWNARAAEENANYSYAERPREISAKEIAAQIRKELDE